MASGHLCRLPSLLTRLSSGLTLKCAQTCLVPTRQKSSINGPSLDNANWKVEIGVTSDGKTIVCSHPAADIPYELTQPIEHPSPLTNPAETHDQVLKAHLSQEIVKEKGPSIEELSKMFYTTKHRWYPVGQHRMRRRKKDPPQDR